MSIAIPAFNEAVNIKQVIAEIAHIAADLQAEYRCRVTEFIVVDDGSTDETAVLVRECQQVEPRLILIQHEENKGYGTAVHTALARATADLVFFTDADRQFDLGEITRLLPHSEHAALVVGYRAPRRDPFMRRLNGKGWSLLVTLLFGYTARDIDCAFKLMRREVIETVLPTINAGGATFSAEFLVRAVQAGFRLVELPLRGHQPRTAGKSTGAHPRVIARAFRELLSFRMLLWREQKTGHRRRHKTV